MTTCQVCGAKVNDDDFIVIEGRRVCPACKPLIVQQLREGCLPPMPTSAPIELSEHEFGFEELLKKTWSICQQDWPTLLGLTLMVVIPLKLLQFSLYPEMRAHVRHAQTHFQTAYFGASLFGVIGSLGVAWVVNERVAGRSLSFGAALSKAVPRWLPAIGTTVLQILAITFFMLLLIVPGIIVSGYYIFAIDVVALRGCAGARALDYSKRLVQGRWWRIFGKTLGLYLPPLTPIMVVAILAPLLPKSPFVAIGRDIMIAVLVVYAHVGRVLFFLNLDAVARKTPLHEVTPGGEGTR